MNNKISIGLIDSGIDKSSNIIDNKYIVDLFKKKSSNNDFFLKHGTFCAHLLQKNVPHALIYDLKVFDKKLITSSKNIINAINLCIENNIKLINLSLSVNDPNYYYEFKNICDEAFKKGLIIVASADNIGRVCLPAYLNSVIGVGIAQVENENDFLYMDEPIQIYAKGLFNDNQINDRTATSYATARMTGIIANILIENPHIDYYELLSILKSRALDFDEKKIITKNQDFDFDKNTVPILLAPSVTFNSKNLGKILFVGASNEIDLFKNYSNLLKFSIHDFCIPMYDNPIDFININSLGQVNQLKIPEDFNSSLENCDTIIIGKLPNDLFQEIVEESNKLEKKIFSIYKISENCLINNIKSENIQILHKNNIDIVVNELKKIPSTHIINNQIPVLAIINLNEKQNIFSVELTIRQELLKLKFKIGQISPNPLAEVFGFDYSYSNCELIPERLQSAYAKALIESVNNKMPESDLIVVGVDTPVVPDRLISSIFFDTYTLPSISLLFGFQPDAVILVINELTESEYIIRNIICLEYFLNTKVILIINNGLTEKMSPNVINQNIPDWDNLKLIATNRLNAIKIDVKKKVKIPVLNIYDKDQAGCIIDEIINCFYLTKPKLSENSVNLRKTYK